jgi:hypothetical protein
MVVTPTIMTNMTMPLVGLTLDCNHQLLVCGILCLDFPFHRLSVIITPGKTLDSAVMTMQAESSISHGLIVRVVVGC